jgi:hypothetical protein
MARKGKGGKGGGDAALTADVDTADLDRFKGALSGKLDGNVSDALRKVGEQFVTETRRAVKSGPASGGRRPPYRPHNSREQAARGVTFEVRNGKLVLASDSSKMDAGRRAFPAAWNKSSWSHPVFGRRGSSARQRGAGAWWKPERYADRAEKLLADAGQKALDEADR